MMTLGEGEGRRHFLEEWDEGRGRRDEEGCR